jgi:hypothetical protein
VPTEWLAGFDELDPRGYPPPVCTILIHLNYSFVVVSLRLIDRGPCPSIVITVIVMQHQNIL